MTKKQRIIANFEELIAETDAQTQKVVDSKQIDWGYFVRWSAACQNAIELTFTSQRVLDTFKSISYVSPADNPSDAGRLLFFCLGLETAKNQLIANKYTIERWFEDESEQVASQHSKTAIVFVSYGGQGSSGVVQKVKNFLVALGTRPVLVEEEPNFSWTPNDKVKNYMNLCNIGVAIVTGEDVLENGKKQGRQNVAHEIGMMQLTESISGRIIILKENSVMLPSNYSEFVYESFGKKSLDKCYIRLIKELRAFGYLS